MGETSMIPASGTQGTTEGATQKLTIQTVQTSVSSMHVPVEGAMFPVRVKTDDAKILVRVDVELMRQQEEIERANEEIRRRLRG